MDMSKTSFLIGDEAFEVPMSFTFGDTLLINGLLGWDFETFSTRIDAMKEAQEAKEAREAAGEDAGEDVPPADIQAVMGLVGHPVREEHRLSEVRCR
jgi:hypothetical protein